MAYRNWIFKLAVVALFSSGLPLSEAFATGTCGQKLAKLALARLERDFDEKKIDKLARSAIVQLVSSTSLPDIDQLAEGVPGFKYPPKSRQKQFILDVVTVAQHEFSDEYRRVRKPMLRELLDFLEQEYRIPTGKELSERLGMTESEFRSIYGSSEKLMDELRETNPKAVERLQNIIAFTYANLASKTGRSPTLEEVASAIGLSGEKFEDVLKRGELYKGFDQVKERAMALRPKAFYRVNDTDVFNDARVDRLQEAVENRRVILYTDVVAGAPANETFLAAALKYCEENDGEIVVRPQNMITYGLDPIFLSTNRVHVALNTWELGPNLALRNTKLTAKQINSLTGLDRIGPRGQTQVFGSPKMDVKTVATVKNATSRHLLMTTGAMTDPYYQGSLYIQGRTDEIATDDHMLGALIIEKDVDPSGKVSDETRNSFHLRHIEFIPEKRGFQDLDRFYTAKGSRKAKVLALNLGDTHPGDTDPEVFGTLPDLVDFLKPEIITDEDAFNGHSVSHYDADRAVTKTILFKQGKRDVNAELKLAADQLNEILRMNKKAILYVKDANHNKWLHRWIQDQAYVKDDINREIGAELFLAAVRGNDPLEYGIRKQGLVDGDRVKFLKSGDTLAVGPKNRRVWLHMHGHAGANGAKILSLEALRRGAGRGVMAHTHTYGRRNGAVNVGTLTKLNLSYNRDGLSSWVQSVAFVGENGEIQVLMPTNGRWFAPRGLEAPSAKKFFEPGFPNVVPNNLPSDGTGQLDQFNRRSGR